MEEHAFEDVNSYDFLLVAAPLAGVQALALVAVLPDVQAPELPVELLAVSAVALHSVKLAASALAASALTAAVLIVAAATDSAPVDPAMVLVLADREEGTVKCPN